MMKELKDKKLYALIGEATIDSLITNSRLSKNFLIRKPASLCQRQLTGFSVIFASLTILIINEP